MSSDTSDNRQLKFKISAILVILGFLLFATSFLVEQDTSLQLSNTTVDKVENMNDESIIEPMRGNSSAGLNYSDLSEEQQRDIDRAEAGKVVENPNINFPLGTFIVNYEDGSSETFTSAVDGNLLPAIILISLGLMFGGTVSMFKFRSTKEYTNENPEKGDVVRSHMNDTKWDYVIVGYDDTEKNED